MASPWSRQKRGVQRSTRGTDQPVGRLEPVVEPVIDVAELQELDVRKLDDL